MVVLYSRMLQPENNLCWNVVLHLKHKNTIHLKHFRVEYYFWKQQALDRVDYYFRQHLYVSKFYRVQSSRLLSVISTFYIERIYCLWIINYTWNGITPLSSSKTFLQFFLCLFLPPFLPFKPYLLSGQNFRRLLFPFDLYITIHMGCIFTFFLD